jgi:hypothetical protein
MELKVFLLKMKVARLCQSVLGPMLIFIAFLSLHQFALAQTPVLLGKPICGAVSSTSAKVWVMVKNVENLELRVQGTVYKLSAMEQKNWNGHVPLTFELKGLTPNSVVRGATLGQRKAAWAGIYD